MSKGCADRSQIQKHPLRLAFGSPLNRYKAVFLIPTHPIAVCICDNAAATNFIGYSQTDAECFRNQAAPESAGPRTAGRPPATPAESSADLRAGARIRASVGEFASGIEASLARLSSSCFVHLIPTRGRTSSGASRSNRGKSSTLRSPLALSLTMRCPSFRSDTAHRNSATASPRGRRQGSFCCAKPWFISERTLQFASPKQLIQTRNDAQERLPKLHRKRMIGWVFLVGPPGFEPGTSCTPSKRASQAAPRPEVFSLTQTGRLAARLPSLRHDSHLHIVRQTHNLIHQALLQQTVGAPAHRSR